MMLKSMVIIFVNVYKIVDTMLITKERLTIFYTILKEKGIGKLEGRS